MRTGNWFWREDHFLSLAAWIDRSGTWLLLPTIALDIGVRHGLKVNLTRVTIAWMRWRFQIDAGVYINRLKNRPLDWGQDGLDEMLRWARDTGRGIWTRAHLEQLFSKDPSLYALIAMGGRPSHYTRELIVNRMQDMEDVR